MILRAELYRFLRNGAAPALLIVMVGMIVLSVYGTSVQYGHGAATNLMLDQQRTLALVDLGFAGTLFAMIFGALSVTRDFTTQAVGRIRLLAGGSGRLLASRAVVVAPAMISFGVFGAAAAIVTAAAVLPGLRQ
jgi:hypothetical protein